MPLGARAQDSSDFNTEKFSFFLNNKIMDDGSIQELGLGMGYTGDFSGELRVRRTKTEKNEEFGNAEDSLNAANSEIYEVFFYPLKYSLVNTPSARIWAGIGAYYYDETLKEKGFFNMAWLETLTPPMERVNSYKNNFSMRVLGPILNAGVILRDSNWFSVSLSVGVVPVFATWARQKVSIVPLMDPNRVDHSQNNSGSPYLYCDLSAMVSLPRLSELFSKGATPSDWKIGFSFLFDYTRLQFDVIDFRHDGSGFNWYIPEKKAVTRSFKLEGTLLIPIEGMHLEIGLGRMFDSVKIDSGASIRNDRNYFSISGKLIRF